jgi:hypothetical protein
LEPNSFVQAIDLPTVPALHGSRIKPPDPDEDVDGAHKVPGGNFPFGFFGDAIAKWNPILPARCNSQHHPSNRHRAPTCGNGPGSALAQNNACALPGLDGRDRARRWIPQEFNPSWS